jgi:Rieske Fe-S protein
MAESMPSRRAMVRGCAVTVAGAVAGFLVARRSDAASSRTTGTAANGYGATVSGGRRLADVDQVPVGGGLILDQQNIVLTRTAGNSVHAFSATCTHQGCTVNQVSGGTIDCPCHNSRFDVRTGAVVSGPAPRPLPSIEVSVRGNDIYTS